MNIDIHGSCVSFNIIKKDTNVGDKWKLEDVDNNLFIDHVSFPNCFTNPIIPDPTDYSFNTSEHVKRNLLIDLKKEALSLLESSDANWLIIDFYTMARINWVYEGGCYTHVALLEIIAEDYWNEVKNQIKSTFRWIDLPLFVVQEKIDQYMSFVIKKYGKDHIVLNRTYFNDYYIDMNYEIKHIDTNVQVYGGGIDNSIIRKLEDYTISKWNLKSIDVSRYYMADFHFENDILAVHYEQDYYRLAGKQLKEIVSGKDSGFKGIDLKGLKYKLDQNKRICIGDREYFECAELPFCLYEPLDDIIINSMGYEDMRLYSDVIYRMYCEVFDKKEYFFDDTVSRMEKQEHLIKLFETLTKNN